MSARVAVIGAGLAGVATALTLGRAGVSVHIVNAGIGASGQSSGAFDFSPWFSSEPEPVLEPDVREALRAVLTALGIVPGAATLVTGAGLLRSAAARDARVLDVGLVPPGARIGVVDAGRSDFAAAALARALSVDPRAGGRTFEVLQAEELLSSAERALPLAALASRFALAHAERLVTFAQAAQRQGYAALLVGPWLGADPVALTHLDRAPLPLGETTSSPDGSAGLRLSARLASALHDAHISLTEGEVLRAEKRGDGFWIQAREHSAPAAERSAPEAPERTLGPFPRVVLATGGLIGGGLAWMREVGGAVDAPLWPSGVGAGSFRGWDPAADQGAWLRSAQGPGLLLEPEEGLFAVGDVRAGSPQTALGAVLSGVLVGQRIAAALG